MSGERHDRGEWLAPVTRLASRRPLPAEFAVYLEHGAADDLQARVWFLRDQGDFGWQTIVAMLDDAGERRPDGQSWTVATARRRFGEPAWRYGDELRRDGRLR